MGPIELALRAPLSVFLALLALLWLAGWLGARRARGLHAHVAGAREEFDIVLGATLTLLALLIGFTFSMALSRFDERKQCEAREANAIGTEYLRAGLLAGDAARDARALLRDYLDLRIAWYTDADAVAQRAADARGAQLEAALWGAVQAPALASPTPVAALVAAGMNDALDARALADAARMNRIPAAAWLLLAVIAMAASFLLGLRTAGATRPAALLAVLPLVVAVALALCADIDSPRRGLISVGADNLRALAASLAPR